MCTVTCVPLEIDRSDSPSLEARTDARRPVSFRLISNRDESRRRSPARPPEIRTFGGRKSIMPIDPVSDGTWIAVNDAGVAMTILNRNPRSPVDGKSWARGGESLQSRGDIIPSLLSRASAKSAGDAASLIRAADYPPFRLVISDERSILEFVSDGASVQSGTAAAAGTLMMFASSGLGDDLVDPPRRELFLNMFGGKEPEQLLETQQAFHQHVWPDRSHLSVCMSRDDAWTVSMTTIDVTAARVSLTYRPGQPNQPAHSVRLELPRRPI